MALIKGINYAINLKYKVLITMDADGQHPIELIPEFLNSIIENNYKVVIGVRNKIPRFSEKLFNIYTKNIHGLIDALSGMKAYSVDIFNFIDIKKFKNSIGTYYALESSRNNNNIKQININVIDRIDGQARIGNTCKVEFNIIKALLGCILVDIFYKISMGLKKWLK